eukprot:3011048-Amphidinium_carterae.1
MPEKRALLGWALLHIGARLGRRQPWQRTEHEVVQYALANEARLAATAGMADATWRQEWIAMQRENAMATDIAALATVAYCPS